MATTRTVYIAQYIPWGAHSWTDGSREQLTPDDASNWITANEQGWERKLEPRETRDHQVGRPQAYRIVKRQITEEQMMLQVPSWSGWTAESLGSPHGG